MKKLILIALAATVISVQAMDQNTVSGLLQENKTNQKEVIYCCACDAAQKDGKQLDNACQECIRFITLDGKKFRLSKGVVPEHWGQTQAMTGGQQNGYVSLHDIGGIALELNALNSLSHNEKLIAQLRLEQDEIKEDYQARVLSLQNPQELYDVMQQTFVLSGGDRNAIWPLAERFALLVKDAEFDVSEFAQDEDISPVIKSAVVSWLKILDNKLKIPQDEDKKVIETSISFKDWSKYNNAALKIIKDSSGEVILNLSGLWLSDINGLSDFLNQHKLACVNLSYNKISSLSAGVFSNCPKLQRVWLDNNQISSLSAGVFSNCPQLQNVWLSNNEISSLSAGVFSNCPQLQYVWLYHNKISSLPAGAFNNCP